MILSTRYSGDVTVRSGVIGDSSIPAPGYAASTYTGVSVNVERATGLAAWGAAIQLIATTIATLDLEVYTGAGASRRSAATSPVAKLLERPWMDGSAFDWLSDIATGVEAHGNAFLFKRKARGRIVELEPISPDHVRVRRAGGVKVFDVWGDQGWSSFTGNDVLHVRGFTVRGFLSGFTPVQMHRNTIANALGLEEFEGRYFRNNASPGIILEMPGRPDREQSRLMLETWQADHQGLPNAHRPGIVWNGTKVTHIPVNMSDAQFIEAKRYGVEEVARITGVPASLLDATTAQTPATTEQDWLRFMRMCLYPRARRIISALTADTDLFPDRSGLELAFEYDSMLSVDAVSQATVDKEHVQSGIFLVDEIRARKGLGPLPPIPADWTQAPGTVPQLTPVGGSPNPTVNTVASPAMTAADTTISDS